MSRDWVATVLRVRQLQEDVERQRLADARRVAQEAHLHVLAHNERLDSMLSDAEHESVLAFVAAASARHSAAATWAAARHDRAIADDQVTARTSAVSQAAQKRRGVERLAESRAAEEQARESQAQQKRLDEIGARPSGDST